MSATADRTGRFPGIGNFPMSLVRAVGGAGREAFRDGDADRRHAAGAGRPPEDFGVSGLVAKPAPARLRS